MRRNISPGSSRRIPLTGPAFGDIVTPLKWHRRRRTRKGGTQRGTQMVKVPCVRGGGTTPEPPGKGPGRDPPVTVGHKRQDVRAVLPGAPRFGVTLRALRDGQLFPAPPKIPPGFARPVFRSARLTVVCSRALRALVSRFACSQRTASLRLGLVSGACGPSPRPRSGPSVLLATAQTLLASRVEPWDFRLTPESSSGVGLFYCLPQNTRRNYHGRRKQRV